MIVPGGSLLSPDLPKARDYIYSLSLLEQSLLTYDLESAPSPFSENTSLTPLWSNRNPIVLSSTMVFSDDTKFFGF